MKYLFPLIRFFIKRDFGERCDEYAKACACCESWKVYDLLENLYAFELKKYE